MVCIYCGGDTQVINSRLQKRPNNVWRRRKCLKCDSIVSTHEQIDYAAAWRVKTMNGKSAKLVPFNRDKLLLSLYKSLEHRKSALADASALADTIISKLRPKTTQGVLETSFIANLVQTTLNRFDKAASVHYAAFHPGK